MLPRLTQKYATDEGLGNSEFFRKQSLIGDWLIANPQHLRLREFYVRVRFSARHNFWVNLGVAYMSALRYTIPHIDAIIPSEQMHRTKASGRVAMVTDQDAFGNLPMQQNIGKSMGASMLARYFDLAVSIPEKITIPQEAWI